MRDELSDWLPFRLKIVDHQPLFQWLYLGEHRFAEPFFNETVMRCLSHPNNSTQWQVVSPLSGLLMAAQSSSALQPDAFIFHVSRCGSTLLSQLLTIPESHIVVSEMPLIDEILRTPFTNPAHAFSADEQDRALQAVIQLLGRQRRGNETRFFIKLDSWHLAFYDTFRRLYPAVPFVFLYRSPDAVLRSHQKQRGMQAVPGVIEPEVFGFDRSKLSSMSLDEYTAAVLERYFRAMLRIVDEDKNVHLVQYQQSGPDLFRQLTDAIAFDVSPADMRRITERSQFHAKYPGQRFDEALPQEPLAAYLEEAMALYRQLDSKRIADAPQGSKSV